MIQIIDYLYIDIVYLSRIIATTVYPYFTHTHTHTQTHKYTYTYVGCLKNHMI